MNGLLRIWLVCTNDAGARYDFRRTDVVLAGASLRALFCTPPALLPSAVELAAHLHVEATALEDGNVKPALDSLAARHVDEQIVLVAPADFVRTALALCLALDPARITTPAAGSIHVIDWPTPADPAARPALIGLDLDWPPPAPAKHRAKFPGGPGSAPSARA